MGRYGSAVSWMTLVSCALTLTISSCGFIPFQTNNGHVGGQRGNFHQGLSSFSGHNFPFHGGNSIGHSNVPNMRYPINWGHTGAPSAPIGSHGYARTGRRPQHQYAQRGVNNFQFRGRRPQHGYSRSQPGGSHGYSRHIRDVTSRDDSHRRVRRQAMSGGNVDRPMVWNFHPDNRRPPPAQRAQGPQGNSPTVILTPNGTISRPKIVQLQKRTNIEPPYQVNGNPQAMLPNVGNSFGVKTARPSSIQAGVGSPILDAAAIKQQANIQNLPNAGPQTDFLLDNFFPEMQQTGLRNGQLIRSATSQNGNGNGQNPKLSVLNSANTPMNNQNMMPLNQPGIAAGTNNQLILDTMAAVASKALQSRDLPDNSHMMHGGSGVMNGANQPGTMPKTAQQQNGAISNNPTNLPQNNLNPGAGMQDSIHGHMMHNMGVHPQSRRNLNRLHRMSKTGAGQLGTGSGSNSMLHSGMSHGPGHVSGPQARSLQKQNGKSLMQNEIISQTPNTRSAMNQAASTINKIRNQLSALAKRNKGRSPALGILPPRQRPVDQIVNPDTSHGNAGHMLSGQMPPSNINTRVDAPVNQGQGHMGLMHGHTKPMPGFKLSGPVNPADVFQDIQGLTIKDLANSNYTKEQILNALANNFKSEDNPSRNNQLNRVNKKQNLGNGLIEMNTNPNVRNIQNTVPQKASTFSKTPRNTNGAFLQPQGQVQGATVSPFAALELLPELPPTSIKHTRKNHGPSRTVVNNGLNSGVGNSAGANLMSHGQHAGRNLAINHGAHSPNTNMIVSQNQGIPSLSQQNGLQQNQMNQFNNAVQHHQGNQLVNIGQNVASDRHMNSAGSSSGQTNTAPFQVDNTMIDSVVPVHQGNLPLHAGMGITASVKQTNRNSRVNARRRQNAARVAGSKPKLPGGVQVEHWLFSEMGKIMSNATRTTTTTTTIRPPVTQPSTPVPTAEQIASKNGRRPSQNLRPRGQWRKRKGRRRVIKRRRNKTRTKQGQRPTRILTNNRQWTTQPPRNTHNPAGTETWTEQPQRGRTPSRNTWATQEPRNVPTNSKSWTTQPPRNIHSPAGTETWTEQPQRARLPSRNTWATQGPRNAPINSNSWTTQPPRMGQTSENTWVTQKLKIARGSANSNSWNTKQPTEMNPSNSNRWAAQEPMIGPANFNFWTTKPPTEMTPSHSNTWGHEPRLAHTASNTNRITTQPPRTPQSNTKTWRPQTPTVIKASKDTTNTTNNSNTKHESKLKRRKLNITKETRIITRPIGPPVNAHTNALLGQIVKELKKAGTTQSPLNQDINHKLSQILDILKPNSNPSNNIFGQAPAPTTPVIDMMQIFGGGAMGASMPQLGGAGALPMLALGGEGSNSNKQNQFNPMEMLLMSYMLGGNGGGGQATGLTQLLTGMGSNGTMSQGQNGTASGQTMDPVLVQAMVQAMVQNNDNNNNGCGCYSKVMGCPHELFPRMGRRWKHLIKCKKDEIRCCDDN